MFYQFDINDVKTLKTVRDITANVRPRTQLIEQITLYDSYDVVDGDTCDIIAHKLYGSSEYHWAIMLANEIYDNLEDFPMNSQVLEDYNVDKYNRFDVSTWSYSGTTVTLTSEDHGISSGSITVSNARTYDSSEYSWASTVNGTFTLSSVTDDTVVYTASGAITGTATGSATLRTSNRDTLTHHYEDSDDYVVASDEIGATAVTNRDYEVAQNDAKRRIKIISPQIIAQVAREFASLIRT